MGYDKRQIWQIVKRGVRCVCPKCGQGKIFTSYLKQVDNCSICSEKLGHIRADDGPAWLTILLVGHIIAPLLLYFMPDASWPALSDTIIISVILVFTLILTFLLLPLSKGIFINLIWKSGCPGSEQ